MNSEQPNFRELFDHLHAYKGESAYEDVLMPWQGKALHVMERIGKLGAIEARHLQRADNNKQVLYDLWDLYALSRVSNTLLLRFQQGDYDGAWPGPPITTHEYSAYLRGLGMERLAAERFHPFFHEIVTVEQSPDPTEPITLIGEVWPGFMLGAMLFARAGVVVRGGRDHIIKEVAEHSTLYFTYRRKNRPYSDQSHGWGSNSQWRTLFHRNYVDRTTFYYNVDGKQNVLLPIQEGQPDPERDSFTPAERVELLVNRCFIVTEKPHNDLYPFDETYIETCL